MPTLPDQPDPSGTKARSPFGALRAALDAIFKSDDRIAGRAVTRLTADLPSSDTSGMLVESTIGFGEYVDRLVDPGAAGNARVLINGEIITAAARRSRVPFQFTTLTRGEAATTVLTHPAGSLVYDLSHNASAIDHLRRGFLVEYALGEDLEVIARNLGLHRCAGMSQEALRRVIMAVAYLPKSTAHAFREALTALLGNTNFSVVERTTSDPFVVFVEVAVALSTDIRGRFLLNGGEPQLTTGLNTVVVDYDVRHVLGVYADTVLARRGYRQGMTNYLNPGGSFVGPTITLGTSPGPAGTPVIVDYGAFPAHYLALDETVRATAGSHWAYLSDPLFAARCLLDQIRAAGVQVRFSTRL